MNSACGNSYRTCPVPTISYFEEVSSASAKGPRQWSFWVLMPISSQKPNSAPSVKRVEAFQYTAADSTPGTNLMAFASLHDTIESLRLIQFLLLHQLPTPHFTPQNT